MDRWLDSSIKYHFNSIKTTIPLVFNTQEDDRDYSSFVELIIDNKTIEQLNFKHLKIICDITTYIKCNISDEDYEINNIKGLVLSYYTDCIPVFRFGPEEDQENDDSFISNLKGESVCEINDFGKHKDGKVLHSSISRTYKLIYKKR